MEIRGVDASQPWKKITKDQLRFAIAELHYGMASVDPIMMITFHDKKYQKKDYSGDPDANPHRRKLYLFWNPPAAELEDSATVARLTAAASIVAEAYEGKDAEPDTTPSSPIKPKRTSGAWLGRDVQSFCFKKDSVYVSDVLDWEWKGSHPGPWTAKHHQP